MEWILMISLFSTSDVLIDEQRDYKSCVQSMKKFKKEYSYDKDIKKVQCVKGVVVDEYSKVDEEKE